MEYDVSEFVSLIEREKNYKSVHNREDTLLGSV